MVWKRCFNLFKSNIEKKHLCHFFDFHNSSSSTSTLLSVFISILSVFITIILSFLFLFLFLFSVKGGVEGEVQARENWRADQLKRKQEEQEATKVRYTLTLMLFSRITNLSLELHFHLNCLASSALFSSFIVISIPSLSVISIIARSKGRSEKSRRIPLIRWKRRWGH